MGHLATLRLLSRGESRQYMEHRVRIAGSRQFPFDDQATEAVFELSRNVVRAFGEEIDLEPPPTIPPTSEVDGFDRHAIAQINA